MEPEAPEQADNPRMLVAELPDGPTSPSLSMLNCCWRDYLREQADADDVLAVLGQVTQFIEFELETLRQQIVQGISDPDNPTLNAIVKAFELHLDANEKMAQEFADESVEFGESFVSGFVLAQKATQQLIDAHQNTMEHIQAMALVNCIFCEHSNSRESGRCSQCGRSLPGVGSESNFSVVQQEGLDPQVLHEPALTRNFVELDEAVEKWQDGDLDDAGLLEVLTQIEKRLYDHLAESETYAPTINRAPQAAQESLLEGLDLTQQALKASLAALGLMRQGFDGGKLDQVCQGFEDFEAASDLMMQAYRHSRQAARLASPTG